MRPKRIDLLRMEFNFSWDTESWFLPLKSALEGLSSADASWQPPGGGNTIWQTVNHLNYYNAHLVALIHDTASGKKALNTEMTFGDIGKPTDAKWEAILSQDSFGVPGDPADTENWKATMLETRLICGNLRNALAEVDDSQLGAELSGFLARQILHTVYHLGQIVLLRKQQGSWPKERE